MVQGFVGVILVVREPTQVEVRLIGVQTFGDKFLKQLSGHAVVVVLQGDQRARQLQARGFGEALHQRLELVFRGLEAPGVDQEPGIESAQATVVREATGLATQVINGFLVALKVVKQFAFQGDGRLEIVVAFENVVDQRQRFFRIACVVVKQCQAVGDVGLIRMAVMHFTVEPQQFLLLFRLHGAGLDSQGVKLGDFALGIEALHVLECLLKLVVLQGTQGCDAQGLGASGLAFSQMAAIWRWALVAFRAWAICMARRITPSSPVSAAACV